VVFLSSLKRFLIKAVRKITLSLLSLLLTANLVAAELEPQSPKPIPVFHDTALKAFFAQSKNSPVIVTFWASWCEPCRDEMPALQNLAERWQSRGLEVITIAVADTPERASNFLMKIQAKLPLIHDPEQRIAQSWGVYMLPVTFVLNRQHRIVASSRGAIEWDTAPVEQKLQSLLQRR